MDKLPEIEKEMLPKVFDMLEEKAVQSKFLPQANELWQGARKLQGLQDDSVGDFARDLTWHLPKIFPGLAQQHAAELA